MRIGGLFVGVDEQLETSGLRALLFAGADAEALHASFADLNDDATDIDEADVRLLLGRAATRQVIFECLDDLAARAARREYDLLVVHFSCHGSPDGALLLYDADASNEQATGIPYAELIRRVSQVASKHVVIVLDVCYSGMCAGIPRQETDDDALLRRLRDSATGNRAVVWAARASERAWELPRLGHGVLTFGLLAGLDGTTLAEAGRISITRWIDAGVEKAEREARTAGHTQRPGRALHWEGTAWLPARPVGPRRRALLLRSGVRPITADPASLVAYGFSSAMCEAVARSIQHGHLNDMQMRAVERAGAMAGRNVLVVAPTSSGKTLVGELAALAAICRRQKTVFALPTRALATEKWLEFQEAYGNPLDLRIVRSLGGVEDDDVTMLQNGYAVAFLTYEKLLAMALSRPALLDAIGTIVLDEVHLLGDGERGRTVEMLLLLLRQRQKAGLRTQVVGLSAVLGDLNGFDQWLEAEVVKEDKRPVPLREGVVTTNGLFRFREGASTDPRVERLFLPIPPAAAGEYPDVTRQRIAVAATLALTSADTSERILAFRAFKPQTRRLAEAIGASGAFASCDSVHAALSEDVEARDDSRATSRLLACLRHGVAFHLADLEQRERELIEHGFRSGQLRALVATSGLAMGINSPASTVVIVDTEHYDGQVTPYSVGEYRNMAGRAGRWLSTASGRGTAVLIAEDAAVADRLFATYVEGQPEPLVSQLSSLDREDLVLALLAVVDGRNPVAEDAVHQVALATFDAFVHRHSTAWRQGLRSDIVVALTELARDGFVVRDLQARTVALTDAGRVCGREGLSVESARRVLNAVRTLVDHGERIDSLTLVALAQITNELDAVFTPADSTELSEWTDQLARLLPKRPVLRQCLMAADSRLSVARLKRTFAVLRWTQGIAVAQIEEEYGRWYRQAEPSAGVVRGVATRTGDMLRGIARVLAVQHPDEGDVLRHAVVAMRPRLEFGIGQQGAELTRYRLGLRRAEMRALAAAGILTFADLAAAVEARSTPLRAILGDSRLGQISNIVRTRAATAARQRAIDEAAQGDLYDRIAAIDEL